MSGHNWAMQAALEGEFAAQTETQKAKEKEKPKSTCAPLSLDDAMLNHYNDQPSD